MAKKAKCSLSLYRICAKNPESCKRRIEYESLDEGKLRRQANAESKRQCISNLSPEETMPHQWRRGSAQNWKTGGARFKPLSRLPENS